ncbi:thiol reductase thioredoxin [Bacterioplanes sanyensis]|uniref:Thiol reductase thioredoxin n=1 Tax=Bacterioplanes sanyensis TaxID=1249553 RepID=A0A222FJZ5_9GAMM|nr:thioredoxin family protein [Bacterioplanes sanyensis]ASP38553.1 thiol reductase thioredoxin [Bacterioplanes sanyensis]
MKYLICLAALIFSIAATAQSYRYNPDADVEALLANSTQLAQQQHKQILIVFGSEWCPDCRSFNKKLAEEPLASTVQQRYIVMHVDIGHWDKNMEFTQRFGDPVGKGIPSIAIIDAQQKLRYVAEGGEFASARHSKVTSINDWFVALDDTVAGAVSASE